MRTTVSLPSEPEPREEHMLELRRRHLASSSASSMAGGVAVWKKAL
jgi:hypothetical protein